MSQRPVGDELSGAARARDSIERFPALDGFRALAMLSVFLFHAWLPIPRLIFTKVHLLPGVIWHGNAMIANFNIGVAMFFGLSGFLIYRPFAAAHIARRRAPDVANYARRRALRIYPAYWLIFLVLLASSEFVHLTRPQLIANLALVQTWFNSTASSGIGQAWTLVVEVTFYAFVPLWSGLVRHLARARDPVRCELAGAILLVLVGFGASWFDVNASPPRWVVNFLPHLTALGSGMLLAVISVQAARDERWRHRLATYARYPALWWLAAAAVFWFSCARVSANPFFTLDIHGLGWQELLQPIVAILMLTPLVISPGLATPILAALSWRPIAWMGTISYGAYLWHTRVIDLNVVQATMRHSGPGRGLPAILGGTLVAFALTLFAGAVSWYAVERPLMRVGQRRARRHALH